jgi:NADH-quinone oxidoreductase E subunit
VNPYLKTFKSGSEFKPDTIEYKIGEIFSELKNKLQSGYTLRKIINIIDELRFKSNDEKDELSSLYEDKIKNMGNSGRNGGEYYTPRPLIKTIVKIINPKLGDKIYDPACGSAGFLCAAYEYLRQSKKELSAKELETLQRKTLYGKEKKSLAYIIGVMNMILHGIEAPNILHTNTLAENLMDVQEKSRVDIILANPPFGSSTEQTEVQQNFPIRSGETAYLFLQHFIKLLKTNFSNKMTFQFTSQNQSEVKKIIAKYPAGRQKSAVMPLLDLAQRQNNNFISQDIIEHIANLLELPPIKVYEVASFYSMYNLKPVGKYLLQVCGTTPCMLRGAEDLIRVCKDKLGINREETSEDKLFTLKEVECLGACVNAPMIQINDDYYEDLNPEIFATILDDLKAGKPVRIGSQTGRVSSEPKLNVE